MLKIMTGRKRAAAIAVSLITSLVSSTVYASTEFKQVKVLVNSQPVFYAYTAKATVGELLNDLGIELNENDVLVSNEGEKLKEGDKVEIKRSNKVTIYDGDKKSEIYTTYATVSDLIDNKVIELDEELDFMNVTKDDVIFSDMKIVITRVSTEEKREEIKIPYQTITRENTNMFEGETRVVQHGQEGLQLNITELIYHNGIEAKKEYNEYIVSEAIDEIIEYGTKPKTITASGQVLGVKKVLTASATAYCACSRCCGKSTGITASGRRAEYGVVAVDPRVIPLGTKLYIETPDGGFVYGYSIAADTGGAIKGNKVDLFYPSHTDALNFGRKTVSVYVLE